MFYIYEKNLNTNKVRFYTKVRGEQQAKKMVREMNLDSLYDDLFYFIGENPNNEDE